MKYFIPTLFSIIYFFNQVVSTNIRLIYQFIWRPYLKLQSPSPQESEVWSATTYIICLHVVEMHQADRVKLQFGFPQYPPSEPHCLKEFHEITMHTTMRENMFQKQIAMWNHRRQLVLTGVPYHNEVQPDQNYISWYWNFFGYNLFLSRDSLLIDPRTHIVNIAQNQPNYPPTPQPNTQNQTHNSFQSQHNYASYTPQPSMSQYPPSMHPSFQNSPIPYELVVESSHHGQRSHHSSSPHILPHTTYAESSHRSHQLSPYENFDLPPAFIQSSYPEPPPQNQRPRPTTPTHTSTTYVNLTQMAYDLFGSTPVGTPAADDAMNNMWVVDNEPQNEINNEEEQQEEHEEYNEELEEEQNEDDREQEQQQVQLPRRTSRKPKPVECGTHGHKRRPKYL